jgi:hypothetical protein
VRYRKLVAQKCGKYLYIYRNTHKYVSVLWIQSSNLEMVLVDENGRKILLLYASSSRFSCESVRNDGNAIIGCVAAKQNWSKKCDAT